MLGLQPRKEDAVLFGRSLRVFEGTVAPRPDKDTSWCAALLQDTEELLDVGANMGQTSVLAFSAGARRVAAVEAEVSALMLCVENVVSNFPGAPFTPLLCFASDRDDGDTALHIYRYGSANSMYADHAVTAARRGTTVHVPNRTLDSLVRSVGLKPDLVKIDIEGAESLALEGATELARDGGTRFLVEMHSSEARPMRDNAERVLAWARRVDHAAYYLSEHVALNDVGQLAHRGRCHLLIQPKARPYPEYLRGIVEGSALPAGWKRPSA